MSTESKAIKKPISNKTVAHYTVLFLIMTAAIFSLAFINGASFIWESDGFYQHFQLFIDYVEKLKQLISGGGFSNWDWSIGPGADVISSYGYYVVGDPFVYLGVLFPAALREFAYHFLILLRIWFVGGSFLFFARKINMSHHAGLLGAVMYAFSHYIIYNVIRHPFFILPMIWFPLLCYGVEKILQNESGVPFALAVAMSAIANFYFFYKLTVLILIYGVVRYFYLYQKENNFKLISQKFLRCLSYYLIGVVISAVVFLPVVYGFLTGARAASGSPINLFVYTLEYYFLLVQNAFTPGTYYWAVGGFSVVVIFAIVFALRRLKKKSYIGIPIVILGIFLLFPFFASMMNGFSTPYNRFTFVLPFYFALAAGYFLDNYDRIENKDLRIIKYILLVFSAFYLITAVVTRTYLLYLLPVAVGWGLWFFVKRRDQYSFKKFSGLVILLTSINLAGNAINFYYPHGKNAVAEGIPLGESEQMYQNVFGGLEENMDKDQSARVGVSSKDNHVRNQYVYHDVMGVNSYLSITNGALWDFATEMELGSRQLIQPWRNGMDDRDILNRFMGIEHIFTDEANEPYLPESYQTAGSSDSDSSHIAAQTDDYFPLAYAEDTWMPYAEFTELNPAEKEYYLTQGVVLEEEPQNSGMERYNGDLPIEEVPFEITGADETINSLGDNTLEVSEDESQVQISLNNLENLANHDLYVHLEGLDFELLNDYPLIRQNTEYRNRVHYNGKNKSVLQSDKYSFSSYFPRENMLFNMGMIDVNEDELTLQFDDDGKHKIEDMTLYAVPNDSAANSQIAAEKWDNALQIDEFGNDRITGQVTTEGDEVLTTTIPHSAGWSVEVNGEPVETVKSNIGFIGVPLEEGDNEVVFTYQTPFLKAGGIVTIGGFILLGLAQVLYVRNKDD